MELYWLGCGVALGTILTLGIIVLRREYIRYRRKNMFGGGPMLKKHGSKESGGSSSTAIRKLGQRKTDKFGKKIEASVEERESRLEEMLGQMRELILQLTEIVASTSSASGDMADRFEEARQTLENLGADPDVDIGKVKVILLSEIDRMAKSNEILKQQLKHAETGISTQKEQIDRLKTQAHIDTLTQLFNRAAFDERLHEVFVKWRSVREVFSLLLMDIDHFKQINDTHGHLHGDRILTEIAGKIKECIRDADFAARYGGEEFAIIFPDTPEEEALAVGTRIRESIERSYFQVDNRQVRITISGGIAQSGMGWTNEEIIEVADKALYTSKNKGRNRITLGEDRIKESWTSGEGK